MKYYKVNAERHDYFTGWTTVCGELLTEKERFRRFPHLSDLIFTVVEVPKSKTVFIFGARYEM